jgi:3-phosphoinositide dependent protein kinase-1
MLWRRETRLPRGAVFLLFSMILIFYRLFAIKIVSKQLVVKERKVDAIMREKEVLFKLRPHDLVVLLHNTFQDANSLYFVMSYCSNEDLFYWLFRYGCFEVPTAQYYAGQTLCAIEYIHANGILHRDLKPENIMLDDTMRIKLGDFGSAKIAPALGGKFVWGAKSSTFVGTAEYVAPEILSSQPLGPSVDFWSLGCILYRMIAGEVPFRAPNDYLMFQKIEKLDYSFPEVCSYNML